MHSLKSFRQDNRLYIRASGKRIAAQFFELLRKVYLFDMGFGKGANPDRLKMSRCLITVIDTSQRAWKSEFLQRLTSAESPRADRLQALREQNLAQIPAIIKRFSLDCPDARRNLDASEIPAFFKQFFSDRAEAIRQADPCQFFAS